MEMDGEESDDEPEVMEFSIGNEEGTVTKTKKGKKGKKTERDLELELGDDYILDLQKKFHAVKEEERYDIVPEFINGRNLADYIDSDIMERLDQLEREEEARERAGVYDSDEEEDDANMAEIHELAEKIREKKKLMKNDQKLDNTKKSVLPRTTEPKKRQRSVSRLRKEFTELGVDMTGTEDAHFTNPKESSGGKRGRSSSRPALKRARVDSEGNVTSGPRTTPRDKSGVRDGQMAGKLKKIAKNTQADKFNKKGKASESDRRIQTKMPKHLFSGKRGMGKNDRR